MGNIWAFLVLLCLNLVKVEGGRFCDSPTPPLCADDCDGHGYYLNEDESECIRCPTCEPGQELSKPCGNSMNGDAVCISCQEGYFSTSWLPRCTACRTCINTAEINPCEPSSDRQCGECLPGYVRRGGRFAADPDSCPDRCSDLPRDTPACQEWWSQNEGGNENGGEEEVAKEMALDPVDVVPLDDYDEACEPIPPRCKDDCHGYRYYLGTDGLCKMCLQCQPGEELDKKCGNGKNGDAVCRRCPEGSFSVDGRQRCIPCRICVNTVITTECSATTDRECGDCLPGYYQAAIDFPDPFACPNSCDECPNTIPQCQEYCKEVLAELAQGPHSQANPTQELADELLNRDNDVEDAQPPLTFPSDTKNGVEDKVSVSIPHHTSYMTIITVLASFIFVLVLVFVTAFLAMRYIWKKTDKGSVIGETSRPLVSTNPSPEGSQGTPSPRGSPDIYLSRVYNDTVYSIPSSEAHSFEEPWLMGQWFKDGLGSHLRTLGSRPLSVSSNSSSGEEQSNPWKRSGNGHESSHKVITENESGTGVPYNYSEENNGRPIEYSEQFNVRRRSSSSAKEANYPKHVTEEHLQQLPERKSINRIAQRERGKEPENGKTFKARRQSLIKDLPTSEPIAELAPVDSRSNEVKSITKEDRSVEKMKSQRSKEQRTGHKAFHSSAVTTHPDESGSTKADTLEEATARTTSDTPVNRDQTRTATEDPTPRQTGGTTFTININMNKPDRGTMVHVGENHNHHYGPHEPLLSTREKTYHSSSDENEAEDDDDEEGGFEENCLLNNEIS